jgi:hypothetical protein
LAFAAGAGEIRKSECCRPIQGIHENNAARTLRKTTGAEMAKIDDEYFGDVIYEVWRRGGNPDAVDRYRARDFEQQGCYPEEAAQVLISEQYPDRRNEND